MGVKHEIGTKYYQNRTKIGQMEFGIAGSGYARGETGSANHPLISLRKITQQHI